MRTYGRVKVDPFDERPTKWVMVTTDDNGFNDHVYLTALAQTLLLNLNESPFFANYGIPALNSVLTQVFPDFNSVFTQQQYSRFFASLMIARRQANGALPTREGPPAAVYDIQVITHAGVKLNRQIPIPT